MLKDVIFKAESKTIVKSVFSLIALFTTTDRQKQIDQLDILKTLMEFYGHPTTAQPKDSSIV
jgi:hypothetical protein